MSPTVAPAEPAVPPAPFSWTRAVLNLLRPAPVPPGWWTGAALVVLYDLVVIAACVYFSEKFYGDNHTLFAEHKPGTWASVAALAASGVVCLRIWRRTKAAPVGVFWLAFGLLMLVVAGDDQFTGHESLDHVIHKLLRRDPGDPVTDHLDDLFVLLYTLPAFYLAWVHRRRLIEARLTIQLLAIAFCFFVGQAVVDFLSDNYEAVEESLKLTAGCGIFLAFYATLRQPTLPAAWTTPRPPGEWYYGPAADADGSTTLTASRPWVRTTAVLAYLGLFTSIIAALFAVAAAKHEPEAKRFFHGLAVAAVGGAGVLFYAAHQLLGYADGLTLVPVSRPVAAASLRVWRGLAVVAGCVLVVAVSAGVCASRQYPYTGEIHRFDKHDREAKRIARGERPD